MGLPVLQKTTMPAEMFDNLLARLERNGDSDSECIVLSAEVGKWEIDIYGWESENFNLEFNAFGRNEKHGFEPCEPTEEQAEQLQELLKKHSDIVWEEESERKRAEETAIEDERKYGRPDTIFNDCY